MPTDHGRGRAPWLTRLLALGIAATMIGAQPQAAPPPTCRSQGDGAFPPYAELESPPNVGAWRAADLQGAANCGGLLQESSALAVALAGRFRHAGSVEDVASRIGAISSTAGLPYWSTTAQEWRELISEAVALEAADTTTARPDFAAEEILSGRTLYFGQDDTRSSGMNIYSLTVRDIGRDRLSFEITNMTPIRFAFVTLFEPSTLRSFHLVERMEGDVWGYYGLSVVTNGSVDRYEKSLINRKAAFYRFLTGQPAEQAPPLAP